MIMTMNYGSFTSLTEPNTPKGLTFDQMRNLTPLIGEEIKYYGSPAWLGIAKADRLYLNDVRYQGVPGPEDAIVVKLKSYVIPLTKFNAPGVKRRKK